MPNPLQLRTYLSAYKSIPSAVPDWDPARQATWPATTATLVSAGGEALLVDALMTTAEGAALGRWISGCAIGDLVAIYVTHGHADHFYGATAVLQQFPAARLLARPDVAQAAAEQTSPGYQQVWGSFFPGQIPHHPVAPQPMDGDDLTVGGHPVRTVGVGRSDVPHSSIVHIPELHTVLVGDVAYNGMHLWLAGSTADDRAGWLRALDAVEALRPRVVIAGHKDPAAPDDDAGRVLDDTRRYLVDFDSAAATSDSPADLIAAVLERYPDLGNPYTLWVAAHDQPELPRRPDVAAPGGARSSPTVNRGSSAEQSVAPQH